MFPTVLGVQVLLQTPNPDSLASETVTTELQGRCHLERRRGINPAKALSSAATLGHKVLEVKYDDWMNLYTLWKTLKTQRLQRPQ